MTVFNNIILDNIYKKFLNNEESENKEKMKKLERRKYIPFINTFWMTKIDNGFYAQEFCAYNLYTFFIFALLAHLSFVLFKEPHPNMNILPYFFTGICSFIYIFIYKLSLSDYDKYIRNTNDNMLSKPLSKEDFKTVMSNFNNDIVEKIMKENNGELCYKDLKNLDDLLLKQEEVITKAQEDKIISIWQKISREDILARFKQKSEDEIIEELDHMGFAVPEGKTIVEMEKFYRSLKEKKKEENIC